MIMNIIINKKIVKEDVGIKIDYNIIRDIGIKYLLLGVYKLIKLNSLCFNLYCLI